MTWLTDNWTFVAALAVSALSVWWLMPQRRERPRFVGLGLAAAGMVTLAIVLEASPQELSERVLFWVFGGGAVLCGILMITSRNPVYGALWFALVTLCTCGLFLLQSAPFLAAATIIVYAGAIIVTFLFVIMLAQQAGAAMYDRRAYHPLLASVVSFVLLGALLFTLMSWGTGSAPATAAARRAEGTGPNPLSRPDPDETVGTLHGLGRSLFGDYLFAVELGGTVLLVASIGAIAIAPRRSQGTL
jgi:NADH-quinone oxidoreductase subunit J